MSESFRLFLNYNPIDKILTAKIYDINSIDNLDKTINAKFLLYVNYQIEPYYVIDNCNTMFCKIKYNNYETAIMIYRVVAVININNKESKIATSIIVGSNFIIGNNHLVSKKQDNGIDISVIFPMMQINDIDLSTIEWYYNGDILKKKINSINTIINHNGIYEITFRNRKNGFTYFDAIEILDTCYAVYYKFVDDNGDFYGAHALRTNIIK